MKARCFLLLMILFSVGIAYAQDCDPYLPCGPLPWQLPSLPDLQSPTPFPTPAVVATGALTPSATPTLTPTPTPFPTSTPAPTITPFPTFTPFVDTIPIGDSLGTLNAVMAATAIPVYDINGTPVNSNSFDDLADNTGTAFGYARGLSAVNFGTLSPLISFMFTSLFTFLFVRILLLLLPIFIAVWGFIRKLIELIMEFVPL